MSRPLDLSDQQRRRRGAQATNSRRRPDSYSSARRVAQRSSYGTHAGRDLDADARADLERQEQIEDQARARHLALVKRVLRSVFVRGASAEIEGTFPLPDPDAAMRCWCRRRGLDPTDVLQIQRFMLGPRGPERQRRPDPESLARHRAVVQRALAGTFHTTGVTNNDRR